jgi:GNAT superfamily N-acetyltransferase
MKISVRSLAASDKPSWIALWNSYQQFYGVTLPEMTTEATWRRLKETTEPIGAFAADDGASIVGFVHYIFHRSTWMVTDTCYLQDLFVQATCRRRGAARALIEAVYAEADRKGAGRLSLFRAKSQKYSCRCTNSGIRPLIRGTCRRSLRTLNTEAGAMVLHFWPRPKL